MVQAEAFLRRHALVLGFFLVTGAATLSNPGVIVTDYFDDMFVVMDLVWRSSLGQVPHVDFHSPIGQTFYWPFALAAALVEPSPLTLLHANLLIAFGLLLCCMATLPSRLSPPLYFMATAAIIVTAIAPRDIDWAFNDYTHLAPYNRWGWSFIMLSTTLSLVSRHTAIRRLDSVIDGLFLGLLLSLMFYLKVNFFLVGAALTVIGTVLRQLAWRTLIASLATLLLIGFLVELTVGNTFEYLQDIKNALSANVDDLGSAKRQAQLQVSVAAGASYGLLVIGLVWLWSPTFKVGQWLLAWWRIILICASTILAGALIGTQNHNEFELALYVIAVIIVVELARRKLSAQKEAVPVDFADDRAPRFFRPLKNLGLVALFAVTAFMPLLDATSVFAHAIESRSANVCPLPGTEGTSFSKLLFPSHVLEGGWTGPGRSGGPERFISERMKPSDTGKASDCQVSSSEFLTAEPRDLFTLQAQQLVEGRVLIDRYLDFDGTILALNFTNPYPALLETAPPEGALLWWDLRTFSEQVYPSPDPLIGSADVILQGRVAHRPNGSALVNGSVLNSAAMWPIYGPQISREFEAVAETPLWRMWARKAQHPLDRQSF